MSAKRQSKVLCQRAVPYELYKGLTFTTIWLEVNPRKKMLEGLCLCRAFLNLKKYKVLCQRAVPYELYKGLTFTTIWLEVNPRKKMLEGLCLCRAFLNLKK